MKKDNFGIREWDILILLKTEAFVNQRLVAEKTGYSLGFVNRSLKRFLELGYLDGSMQLTEKAETMLQKGRPKNAVILAAGYGMRMVPISLSSPKALLEVKGERLVERIIKQLHEAGITDITIVVGFMKESFEYLIDRYGVDLAVNAEYAGKNNISSLKMVLNKLDNTYVIPSDIWCGENPFNQYELYSWYMVADRPDAESTVRVNRKLELVSLVNSKHGLGALANRRQELTSLQDTETGNRMIGISYLLKADAEYVARRVRELSDEEKQDHLFWEAALFRNGRMIVPGRVVPAADYVEINTYEQLRELDSDSNQLKNDAVRTIAMALRCAEKDIKNITVLKKGMTNRSFVFSVSGQKYIMRIPGEGTAQLINREHEAGVYRAISGRGLCDDPVYIDAASGFKITKYLENVRVCDPENREDLVRCMNKLRAFHNLGLKVEHSFDLFGQIAFYESLWQGKNSIYQDYQQTKERVFSLREFLDPLDKKWCLTHIDAVCDNFLFYCPDGKKNEREISTRSDGEKSTQTDGEKSTQSAGEISTQSAGEISTQSDDEKNNYCGEQLQLTDWEYAGMQDPHVDIAMFCIYSLFGKEQCDALIDLYFEGDCDSVTRTKIYCYIAACGLLWSNWCEYKRQMGVEFGEYSLRQYRYAKDFYHYAVKRMGRAAENSGFLYR